MSGWVWTFTDICTLEWLIASAVNTCRRVSASSSTSHTGTLHVRGMYERRNGEMFVIFLAALKKCIWIKEAFVPMHLCFCQGVSSLPVLVILPLPVAGTTYKLAIIKVFDRARLPRDTSFPTGKHYDITTVINDWREARATDWQCRDWKTGHREGEIKWKWGEERQRKLVKGESEWDWGEMKAE